jgi:ankyrin repeat protein
VAICAAVFAVTRLLIAPSAYDRLDRAIWRHDSAGVLQALEQGADVNGRDYVKNGIEPNVPLMSAVFGNDITIARILLERGAKVNFQYGEGCSPLGVCVYRNQYVLAELLLQYDADPDMQTFYGSPRDQAANNERMMNLFERAHGP